MGSVSPSRSIGRPIRLYLHHQILVRTMKASVTILTILFGTLVASDDEESTSCFPSRQCKLKLCKFRRPLGVRIFQAETFCLCQTDKHCKKNQICNTNRRYSLLMHQPFPR